MMLVPTRHRIAASLRRGCVVAAAGCGKTEQIALATGISGCKRLILTHTHAGVDAIQSRLRRHQVPASKFHLSTIAGWCLRLCRSYPKRSGFDNSVPLAQIDWSAVYEACSRLLLSGAVNGILHAAYGGIFVDEYQDCSGRQHAVTRANPSRWQAATATSSAGSPKLCSTVCSIAAQISSGATSSTFFCCCGKSERSRTRTGADSMGQRNSLRFSNFFVLWPKMQAF